MSTPYAKLPAWADYGLIPLINLLVAFIVAGLVVLLVGENPFRAAVILVEGAFGRGQGIAYTLFYATNFIFTGLAVAVAFRARLWNIGAEAQLYAGAVVTVVLGTGALPWPAWLLLPAIIVSAMLAGALLLLFPAILKTRLGVDEVVTTLLLNFVVLALGPVPRRVFRLGFAHLALPLWRLLPPSRRRRIPRSWSSFARSGSGTMLFPGSTAGPAARPSPDVHHESLKFR